MKSEPIILNTSDEAAKLVTITGWVSRQGVFYGNDERTARYAGATHLACKQCGTPHDKMWTLCNGCRDLADIARFEKLERKPWDGVTPVCVYRGDDYFFDVDSFLDWCADNDVKPEEAMLVHCEPHFARGIDMDHWYDELPQDGELPAELAQALDEFNAKISAYKEPLSWGPSKVAVDQQSLKELAT